MKKNEKYTVVNNQEDEDGYTLYPGYAIYNGNVKEKGTVNVVHKTAKTGKNYSKPRLENFTNATPVKSGRGKK